MRLAQLIPLPRHLLAATIERGRERIPVKVKQIGPAHLVVSASPLATGERARVTIACPLTADRCEVTARAVRRSADSTWLSLVA
jgi:hypothetical protein